MNWHFPSSKDQNLSVTEQLLIHRGLKPADLEALIHPPHPGLLSPSSDLGFPIKASDLVIELLHKAIKVGRPILIYGDYDADGITATAILYLTLKSIGAKVFPFIPDRELHGYGLSLKGLNYVLARLQTQTNIKPLIITVDNGITAQEAAVFLQSQGLDLIITDHHQPAAQIPPHQALFHSTKISGAGVAWVLAKALVGDQANQYLDLACIGTVADLMPVIGVNRSFIHHGLICLRNIVRPGLQALYQEAALDPQALSTYHLGFLIAPRLNAMGRLKQARSSLKILLSTSLSEAQSLAQQLSHTNRDRQVITETLVQKADSLINDPLKPILVVADESFHEGVVGLVAGKLTEKYYRPSIVISRKPEISKASARSIAGINIIELIRSQSNLLVNAGGHPLAAGLSLETKKIPDFITGIQAEASNIDPQLFIPSLKIDAVATFSQLRPEAYTFIESLSPFGLGHPKPILASLNLKPLDCRQIGANHQHLKLTLKDDQGFNFVALGFNQGDRLTEILRADRIDLAYTLEENVWQGRRSLQLHLKDFRLP